MQKCKTVEATLRYFHCLYCLSLKGLSLSALAVAAHELVHATGSVDEFGLSGVEGVRSVRNFKLHHGISFTFEFNGFSGFAGGARKEHIAVTHVFEHNGTIIFRMNTLFHCCYSLLVCTNLCGNNLCNGLFVGAKLQTSEKPTNIL